MGIFAQILLVLFYIASILAFLYGLWAFVPHLYQLPWVPTQKARARKALEMAKLQPGEVLYDLGAGDGRILLMATEEFGAQAVGIEASLLQFVFTWARCFFSGGRSNIRVRLENFYKADLSDADVVFAYLTPTHAIRLQDKLTSKLKPGARVISIAFDFPKWKPNDYDDGYLLFMYEVPPEEGGFAAYLAEQDI
jgi:hypothetical protein